MVELYFEKELSDVIFDNDTLDEYKNLINELGIKGQMELAKGTKTPIPFPWINTSMTNICNTLCPKKVSINEYNKAPIPLDVLKQLKFAIGEKYFERIEVWYDDKTPDPFLIGITAQRYGYIKYQQRDVRIQNEKGDNYFNNEQDYEAAIEFTLIKHPGECGKVQYSDKEKYLIARWGDHLRDFKELAKLATERIIEEVGTELIASIAKAQEKLNTIKQNAPLYIGGNMSLWDLKGSY